MRVREYFKNKKLNSKKLLNYGFIETDNHFIYSTEISDKNFRLDIEIKAPNVVETKITEVDTNETYTLHMTGAQGEFVGKIREEYKNKLEDIAKNCFENDVFKSDYAIKIIEYIKEKYGDEVEYLWEKFPNNAIARRKDNNKWYLALLTVSYNKLGINSDQMVEIIDLRAKKEDVPELIKNENIYEGYHMNKKSWITIILDGSFELSKIFQKIDESYLLAKKK